MSNIMAGKNNWKRKELNKAKKPVLLGIGERKLLRNNRRRRKVRSESHLYSLVAPLTAHSSIEILGHVARRFRIVSNTVGHHLSLAEGLALPHDQAEHARIAEPFRKAMSVNHYARVTGVKLLPTYSGLLSLREQQRQRRRGENEGSNQGYKEDFDLVDERLVLVETEFVGAELAQAVQDLHQNAEYCVMKQYPLHVTLGTVRVEKSFHADLTAELGQMLVGTDLALNWSLLTFLSPPEPAPKKPTKPKNPKKLKKQKLAQEKKANRQLEREQTRLTRVHDYVKILPEDQDAYRKMDTTILLPLPLHPLTRIQPKMEITKTTTKELPANERSCWNVR